MRNSLISGNSRSTPASPERLLDALADGRDARAGLARVDGRFDVHVAEVQADLLGYFGYAQCVGG